VPDPPERNLGDAGFLNPKAKKINLGTERCCCCAAQTVSAFPSTANSTGGNRQQRHGVGEIGKVLQGEPKVGIKEKECRNTCEYFRLSKPLVFWNDTAIYKKKVDDRPHSFWTSLNFFK
jgi:hypothetical protein